MPKLTTKPYNKDMLFLIHVPAILTILYTFYAWNIFASLGMLLAACIISPAIGGMTYHRYFTHRAFKMSKFGHNALIVVATLCGQVSIPLWVISHKIHHKLSDKFGDSHSPKLMGWWTAFFVQWFIWTPPKIYRDTPSNSFRSANHLNPYHDIAYRTDKVMKFSTDWFVPINVTFMVILFFLCYPAFVFYCFNCIAILTAFSLVNTLGHWDDEPTDFGKRFSWITTELGCHKYHHDKPMDYRNPYGDLATVVIDLIRVK